MKKLGLFKFEGFTFDSANYRLTYKGEKVRLRPKALQLLRLLILNRGRVVSKSEILSTLWGSAYARDHLLFQLISELRQTPFGADFIRTQPNEGYQWNAKTKLVTFDFPFYIPRVVQVSTSLMAGVICLSLMFVAWTERNPPVTSVQLPAHSAFSKGVIALESGESDQAVEWFRFALNENPDSAEISLFLAEALHDQDKQDEASEQLQALLLKPHLDDYSQMTATDLLSRIRQRQGLFSDALNYAKMSSRANIIAQCSADVVEQRIELLEGSLAKPIASLNSSRKRESAIKLEQLPASDYSDRCNQLKQILEETSYCQPDEIEDLYVSSRSMLHLRFS